MRSRSSTATSNRQSPLPAPDEGRLQDVGIARLLRAHRARKRTGILTFRCSNAVCYRLYFLEGDIVAASSDAQDLRFGAFLYRLNKITLEQLEEVLEIATAEQQLGELLVEKGFLSSQERQDYLKAQFREILNTVFLLEGAEYDFSPQETIFAENLQLFHDSDELIDDGERLLADLSRFTRDLEANDRVYEIVRPDFVPERREQEELLRYVDGKRTAAEIFHLSPFERMATARTLRLLLAQGVIEAIGVRHERKEEPETEANPRSEQREKLPAPVPREPDDHLVLNAKTVVRVGRSGSEDIEAGLFFSAQSVLDRVDLSHVEPHDIVHAHPPYDVVETLAAEDDDHESDEVLEEVSPAHGAEAGPATSSDADLVEQVVVDDLDEFPIEMDSEGDGLSEIFSKDGEGEVGEDDPGYAASDAEALLHIATDDIEFQETLLDTPLPGRGGGAEVIPGSPASASTEAAHAPPGTPLRHGFPEHPDVAEVTIEEELDDEEYDVLARHIASMEGSSRVENLEEAAEQGIEAAAREDSGLDDVSRERPELLAEQPLFSKPPVLSDLSDDEIVIEDGLDEVREEPLMDTPAILSGTVPRPVGDVSQDRISDEQQAILDSITGMFKKPGARAALGAPPALREEQPGSATPEPASSGHLDPGARRWLVQHGAVFNDVFATIASHFRKKLGDEQTRQVFESFFMPGNSSFPELFIDVQFDPDGRLDSSTMVENLLTYGTHHPAEVFDASLNEVFYFLIRDIHLVLDRAEQDALMEVVMPLRDRLFQERCPGT